MKDLIKKSDCLAEVKLSYKTKVNPRDRQLIKKSQDAVEIFRKLYDEDSIEHIESFYVLMLNRNNKVLGWSKLSNGGISGTYVDVKIIMQLAIISNASAIILSHNHPSGNCKESQQDIKITKQIKEACRLFDIELFDHIILTSDSYFSMADQGLI